MRPGGRAFAALVLAAAVALAGSACSQTAMRAEPVRYYAGPGDEDARRVAIVLSDASRLFDVPVNDFIVSLDTEASVFALGGPGSRERVRRALRDYQPELLFVLGARALAFARDEFSRVPTVFGMVMHADMGDEATALAGVDFIVTPDREFSRYKMFIPRMQRVLTFFSEATEAREIDAVRLALAAQGIELDARYVVDASEIPAVLGAAVAAGWNKTKRSVDAIWYRADPMLVDATTFDFLVGFTRRLRIPLLTPIAAEFTKAGATMSVSVDPVSVGSQAANIAKRILGRGVDAGTIGVEEAVGGKVTINQDAIRALGLDIADEHLPFIDEFVTDADDGGDGAAK